MKKKEKKKLLSRIVITIFFLTNLLVLREHQQYYSMATAPSAVKCRDMETRQLTKPLTNFRFTYRFIA